MCVRRGALGRLVAEPLARQLAQHEGEFLGGEMRDNFGARLSLGRLSPQGAMMMWDSPAIGVALPRNKRGRGVTLSAESLPGAKKSSFLHAERS